MFETTIAGSLPKPGWLAETHKLWPRWKLEGAALAEAKHDATLLWLKAQEDAGIDIVGDGEQSRQHFVHGFLEAIEGIDFERKVKIGIRNNRYEALVPTVVGPLRLKGRVHATEARLARAHTKRRLKFTLPGPMTIVDTVADSYYGDKVKMAMAFAELPQRGGARARRRRRRRHPVRRAGVQRVHGRRQALGRRRPPARRRGPEVQDRGAHLLRLRHQGQPRLEADARRASGASTRRSSRRSRRAASTRCRSNARTRTCRPG